MAEKSDDSVSQAIPQASIIPIVFNGKPYFPGKQQLANSLHILEVIERKEPLVPLDEDPLQREWDEFVEDFPQCSRYLDADFIDRNFPALRERLSGDAGAAGSDDEDRKVVIYDVDAKEFRPDDIDVWVKDGNVLVSGRNEKVINGGGKYVKDEILGGIRVPADVKTNDVTLETTPELRLKISRPDSRPGSAMSSADTSLAER